MLYVARCKEKVVVEEEKKRKKERGKTQVVKGKSASVQTKKLGSSEETVRKKMRLKVGLSMHCLGGIRPPSLKKNQLCNRYLQESRAGDKHKQILVLLEHNVTSWGLS